MRKNTVDQNTESEAPSIRFCIVEMNPDALLTEREVAELLGFKPKTVETWRWRGGGPPFIRTSAKSVRYRYQDVRNWVISKRRISTSDQGNRQREGAHASESC